MRTIDDYLDDAKARNKICSDIKLNFALGYKGLTVSKFRTRRKLPSDTIMMRLADLAHIPKEQALLDLNIWRAAGTPAELVYRRMAGMMRVTRDP